MDMPAETRDVWEDDLLGRRAHAVFLMQFLVNRVSERMRLGATGSYVLNLDAEWGQGKTFFVERFYRQLLDASHPAVFINAWKDDFGDDHLTVVMAEIDAYVQEFAPDDEDTATIVQKAARTVKENYKDVLIAGASGFASRWGSWAIGSGADEIKSILSGDGENITHGAVDALADTMKDVSDKLLDQFAANRIAAFKQGQSSLRSFRDSLDDLVKTLVADEAGYHAPMFIIIDELDRCRPTYAIAMLERIKHLFDVPNLVFVLSTDTHQLSGAVSSVYGSQFDGAHYLQRFFNRTYMLPNPSVEQLIDQIFASGIIQEDELTSPGFAGKHKLVALKLVETFRLTLRQIEQALDILGSLTTVGRDGSAIVMPAMFPLICAFVRNKSNLDKWDQEEGYVIQQLRSNTTWVTRDAGWYHSGNDQIHDLLAADFISSMIMRNGWTMQQFFDNHNRASNANRRTQQQNLARELLKFIEQDAAGSGHHHNADHRSDIQHYPSMIRQAGLLQN
jgi:hypothetical protein